MTAPVTEVLIYARLSVTTEESVSIERQIEAARQYAAARGWTVIGEFTDNGVSATKNKPEDRPGWRKVLAEAEARKPHAVIVWKVDRLARSVLDFLNADNALKERGSGIVAVADPIDMTTPQGKAFATVLAVFAELEAASISARVRDARATLLKSGRRGGGRPPYGWMNVPNPDGPGLVLAQDPATIGYVAEAAARILAGDSLYAVTRWLDESGAPRRPHKGRRNGHWAEASVEAILRNPALAGLTPYAPNRKPGTAPDPWAILRDEDGVAIVDKSVRILTVTERRALLEALDGAKKPGSRPRQTHKPTLLSRLLLCGSCGATLHRSTSGGGFDGYRCASKSCPRQASVNRKRIEQWVIETVLAERGETRQHVYTAYATDDQTLAAIEEALHTAATQLTAADDEEESDRLLARIISLKARRAEARSTAIPTTKKIVTPSRGQDTWGEEFQQALADHDTRRAADLLREQITNITVHPAGQSAHTPMGDRAEISWTPLAPGDEAA